MSFLHGVETIEIEQGVRPISTVRTGVIGLVGTAPLGTPNKLELVTNPRQATEKFGQQLPGFTIPQALDQIFKQGAGAVIVVNVFNASTMVSEVADEEVTVTNGKAKLANAPIGAPVVTDGATTTYTAGTDYKIDAFGNLTVLSFDNITEGDSLSVTYDELDTSAITATEINGTVSGNTRTGMKMFSVARASLNFAPKIIISPTYCEIPAVAAEMISTADSLRATALIDGPSAIGSGDTASDVVQERAVSGTYAGFQTGNRNVMLLWPYLLRYDIAYDATVATPPSPYFAGVMSASDRERGFWFSPSNRPIQGILGVEVDLTAEINDPASDANTLNAAGITTVFSGFGAGIRTWGNRNASFPALSDSKTFVAVRRVQQVVDESVELAMLPFIDQPITAAVIDAIRETVNAYLRSLIQRGALLPGSRCDFIPEDNPATQIANGQLVFQNTLMPPTPAERITFQSRIDINLLSALAESISQ